jgi:hypothetical protein
MWGSAICNLCYQDGPTMEQRIRNYNFHIKSHALAQKAPSPVYATKKPISGVSKNNFTAPLTPKTFPRVTVSPVSDGLICVGCQEYFSFVEANCHEGYRCFSCRN